HRRMPVSGTASPASSRCWNADPRRAPDAAALEAGHAPTGTSALSPQPSALSLRKPLPQRGDEGARRLAAGVVGGTLDADPAAGALGADAHGERHAGRRALLAGLAEGNGALEPARLLARGLAGRLDRIGMSGLVA